MSASSSTSAAAAKPTGKQPISVLDDDEFEEFENEWTAPKSANKEALWQDDWDDDDLTDVFSQQLRAELDKVAAASGVAAMKQ
ncbi:uncharacterized protein AMSG_07981 [Thecamonas trahens ATCC 50062]|uniref:26S proteasome complex subunit DSS1 n=1 Tax=Thecamonas trahens ATCC 50062 TaxID=461836 RepID=A0A0L0DKI5_THETB|nr:hypothetical protein AMSG_07981 [Thecamonas trahens ATCC 50062]KNC51883.1 hypothetical protein AMSG_07981 [Thecamonas trahens ATCC 50062]|eukprot:XP_013755741.1 hypothetical protein AMSG_07981 [Thecamonas trahens ATCC 50062]